MSRLPAPDSDLHPILLVDRQLLLLRANAPGYRWMAANEELIRLENGRLVVPQCQTALLARVARVLTPGTPTRPATLTQALALPRLGGLAPSLLIEPAGAQPDVPGLVARLGIRDPQGWRIDRTLLRQLFELTPTEARVAAALAEGLGTQEIADRLAVRLNTVQTHVKHVLSKTGTSRQPQLVSLLWRCAAAQPPMARVHGAPPRTEVVEIVEAAEAWPRVSGSA